MRYRDMISQAKASSFRAQGNEHIQVGDRWIFDSFISLKYIMRFLIPMSLIGHYR